MEKFKVGESFKLKGCRKTWSIIEVFNHKGREHCVAVTTITSNISGIERVGVFVRNEEGEVYQRS